MPAEAADRIAEPWGERTPRGRGGEWRERVDSHLVVDESAVEHWVPSIVAPMRPGARASGGHPPGTSST